MRGRWRSGRAEPPCDTFRQAISSLLDGEQPPLPAKAVAIHLARCEDCRRFQDGAMDLTAKIPLQASRPVPAARVPSGAAASNGWARWCRRRSWSWACRWGRSRSHARSRRIR